MRELLRGANTVFGMVGCVFKIFSASFEMFSKRNGKSELLAEDVTRVSLFSALCSLLSALCIYIFLSGSDTTHMCLIKHNKPLFKINS
jgi:hypothetical protein